MPSAPYASSIAVHIGMYLGMWNQEHGLSHLTGESGGYIVANERYIPNVAFLAREKGPLLTTNGYQPSAPDLVVEVPSPVDRPRDIRIKIANYLAAGTVVWIVDYEAKEVEVYIPGQRAQRLILNDMLSGGDVLPGFTLAVKDIFPD